jgi:hypothetical protein
MKQARERGNVWRQERGYSEMPSVAQHTYADYLTPMVLLSLNTGLCRCELSDPHLMSGHFLHSDE